MTFQEIVLKNLILNEEYIREVIPFLKKDYFYSPYKEIYQTIEAFFSKFNDRPSPDVLALRLNILEGKLPEKIIKEGHDFVNNIKKIKTSELENFNWLLEETERFCRDSEIELAIKKSIRIISGEDKTLSKDALPDILKQAVSVSFDRSIGHDYFEDYEKRYEYYTKQEEKIAFDLDYLNLITNGGVAKKTLNIFVGGVNVGKTLTLCHLAASYLKNLHNVLYLTMEMSEEEITKRIESNLLDINIDALKNLSFDDFKSHVERLRQQIPRGSLVVKEFPTAVPNINHFRKLLLELKSKKDFTPNVVIVDYINICSSSRITESNVTGTYMLVKAISEELRGFAIENKVPVITATQLNRTGYQGQSTDMDMTSISDSFGTAMTADLIIALVNSKPLEKSNLIIMKQLKNRYGDVTKYSHSYVGIDRSKMRLYNVDNDKVAAQDELDTNNIQNYNIEGLAELQELLGS